MRQSFPEHREASVHGSTYIPVSHQESSKIPALSIPEQPQEERRKEERIGEERIGGEGRGGEGRARELHIADVTKTKGCSWKIF